MHFVEAGPGWCKTITESTYIQGRGARDRDLGGLIGEERHAAGLADPRPQLRRRPRPSNQASVRADPVSICRLYPLLHDTQCFGLVLSMIGGRPCSTWVMMDKVTRRLSKMPEEVRGEISPWFIDRHAIEEETADKIVKPDSNAEYVISGLKVSCTPICLQILSLQNLSGSC